MGWDQGVVRSLQTMSLTSMSVPGSTFISVEILAHLMLHLVNLSDPDMPLAKNKLGPEGNLNTVWSYSQPHIS